MSGTMVIAGEGGGKSTFIGALITYVSNIEGDRYRGGYNVEYGSQIAFDQEIYEPMESNFAYPKATPRLDRYVVRVTTNSDDSYAAKRSLTMMDIPGELQQDAIDKLVRGEINEEKVSDAYNNGHGNEDPIRKKVENGKQLSDREVELLYQYQYISSDRVILLLNLHKFIHRPNMDPVLSTELIDRIAREKRCLLLVTATDEIDYNASKFRSGILAQVVSKFSVSPRLFDSNLAERLKEGSSLPPGRRSSDIGRLIRATEDNDVSMFGVAIPEGPHGDIEVEQGNIKTQGFDNIVYWLMNT